MVHATSGRLSSAWLPMIILALLVGVGAQDTAAHGKPTSITCAGYTVRQYAVPASNEPERLMIQRGAQVLVTVTSAGEIEAKCTDVTGDSRADLIVQTYSGGAHCCFDIYVYQFAPTVRRVLNYEAGNAGGFEVRRLGGRIVVELGDDSFAYYKDLCYACSPAYLPLAACFREGAFVDCTRRYPQVVTRFVSFYTARLQDAMKFTDESRLVYMRGAALGIYAAYALMRRERDGLPAVRRLTTEPAVLTWLSAQQADVRTWLAKRAAHLKR
jgi:hypothetical protein